MISLYKLRSVCPGKPRAAELVPLEDYMFKFIEAKEVSNITDPSTTLGIEVTDPEVAALCGLGNLDGQHVRRDDWMTGLAAACPT